MWRVSTIIIVGVDVHLVRRLLYTPFPAVCTLLSPKYDLARSAHQNLQPTRSATAQL